MSSSAAHRLTDGQHKHFSSSHPTSGTRRVPYPSRHAATSTATSILGSPPSKTTSIYVANIPPSWTSADVFKAFRLIQPITEVYIPRRPNRRGIRYGFLKLSSSANVDVLLRGINEMSLGRHKVHASIALTPRRLSPLAKPRMVPAPVVKPPFIPSIRDHRTYAEATHPQSSSFMHIAQPLQAIHTSPLPPTSKHHTNRLKSHLVDNHLASTPRDMGVYHAVTEELEWLEKCLVARLIQLDQLASIHDSFAEAGIFSIRVRPLGDDRVLLSFDCRVQRDLFFHEQRSLLDRWFFDIRPWLRADSAVSSRFVWLKLYGVPLELWTESFFRWICVNYGAYVMTEASTANRSRLDAAKILISTALSKGIHSSLRFNYQCQSYVIHAREEECLGSPIGGDSSPIGGDFRMPEPIPRTPEAFWSDEVAPGPWKNSTVASPVRSPSLPVTSPVKSPISASASSSFSPDAAGKSIHSLPPSASVEHLTLSSPLAVHVPSSCSANVDEIAVDLCRRCLRNSADGIDCAPSPINLGLLERLPPLLPVIPAALSYLNWPRPPSCSDMAASFAGQGAAPLPCSPPSSAGLISSSPASPFFSPLPFVPLGPHSPSSSFIDPSVSKPADPSPLLLPSASIARVAQPTRPPPSPSHCQSLPPSPPCSRSCRRRRPGAFVTLPPSLPCSFRRRRTLYRAPLFTSSLSSRLSRRCMLRGGSSSSRRSRVAQTDRGSSSIGIAPGPSAPEIRQPTDSDIIRMNIRHRLPSAHSLSPSPISEAIATAEVGVQVGLSFVGDREAVIAAISDQVAEETRLWEADRP